MDWQPVDSINARLPRGVRVFAGQNAALPLKAWYVRIDEPAPDLTTRVVLSDDSTDGRETASSFARDLGACVVANGGYFAINETPSRPVGLVVTDDTLRAPNLGVFTRDSLRYETARAALGFTAAGAVKVAWVSSDSGRLEAWPTLPAHRPGQPAGSERVQAQPWPVRDALGAGPMLLQDGEVRITSDEEVFFGTSIPGQMHPRTAAGVTPDGALVLMVVDGRQPESRGADLRELAHLMQQAGATDALNLDGGGSSALVAGGVLLNRPEGQIAEREVVTALATQCE